MSARVGALQNLPGPRRATCHVATSALAQQAFEEAELIGPALDLLIHQIGATVARVALDAKQDRRVRGQGGLQLGRELAGLHRIDAIVVKKS